MKRNVIAASLAAALAISALGAPALAEAKPNGHNCVGYSASSFGMAMGGTASTVYSRGGMAGYNQGLRDKGC